MAREPNTYAWNSSPRRIYSLHAEGDEIAGWGVDPAVPADFIALSVISTVGDQPTEIFSIGDLPGIASDAVIPVCAMGITGRDEFLVGIIRADPNFGDVVIIDATDGTNVVSTACGAGVEYFEAGAIVQFDGTGGTKYAICGLCESPYGFAIYSPSGPTLIVGRFSTINGYGGEIPIAGPAGTGEATFFSWDNNVVSNRRIEKHVITEGGSVTSTQIFAQTGGDLITGIAYDESGNNLWISWKPSGGADNPRTATKHDLDSAFALLDTVDIPDDSYFPHGSYVWEGQASGTGWKGNPPPGTAFLFEGPGSPVAYAFDLSAGSYAELNAPEEDWHMTPPGDTIIDSNTGKRYFFDWNADFDGDAWIQWGPRPEVTGSPNDLQAILTSLSLLGGYTIGQIVFEGWEQLGELGIPVPGVWADRRYSIREAMQVLCSFYGVHMIESEGKIKFRISLRASYYEPDWELTEDDLVPFEDGTLLETNRVMEKDIPQDVQVHYYPEAVAWDSAVLRQDVKKARQLTVPVPTTTSRRMMSLEAPVIMRPSWAIRLAHERLYEMVEGKHIRRFSVGPKHIALEPADIVELTIDDVLHTMFCNTVRIREDLVQEVEAYDYLSDGPADGSDVAYEDFSPVRSGRVSTDPEAVNDFLLSGDMQGTGNESLRLTGDMQAGLDNLNLSGT